MINPRLADLHRPMLISTALIAIGLMVACNPPPGEAPTTRDAAEMASESNVEGPDIYQVRGEVITVPVEGDVQSTLSIRHEAIDNYKGVGGEIWGMDSMTMPFELAEDVSLDGIAPGDKIAFTLAVDWFGEVPQQITAIQEVDASTEIEFRKARPEGTEESSAEGTDETSEEEGSEGS